MSSQDTLSEADPIAEARWFVRGEVNRSLRPPGRGLRRTDWYHLDTLSTTRSIKRRGDRMLEQKWRVGPTTGFERPVRGHAERWFKQRLGKTASRRRLKGTWIPIGKQLWRIGNVQMGRLMVHGDDDWWTVAVQLPGGELDPSAAELLDRWAVTLASRAHSSAYPAWLIARIAEADTPLTTSPRAS